MTSPYAAISLFSGCGGDTLGLERAGFKVIAFNELKSTFVKTHLENFPHSAPLNEPKKDMGDITKLPDSVFEPYKGQIQIVFSGFPCQSYSKAGKKDVNDSRGQLYKQFVRVVRITQPPFLIGENVSGLLAMKSGPREEDPMVIDAIRLAFAEIGYTLSYQVLEATEFGVPQSRKRLLIAGWKTAQFPEFDTASFWAGVQAWGAQQTVPKLNSFVKPTLEGALKLDSRAVPTNFETVAIPVSQNAEPTGAPHPYVTLKATSFDETYQDKTYDRLLSCGKRDSPIHSEILDLTKPSKTIICTYDHQPRLLVGLRKPDGTAYARCLLPDELKQIQGFPADFKLCGNVKEQIVQIGNAVPPNLVQAVAQGFNKYLDAPPPQQPPAEPKPKRKYKIVRS